MTREAIRYLYATYCDDVREEVGGKTTLVGCYNSQMFLSSIPATLPKLCIQINCVSSSLDDFSAITLFVTDDKNELIRAEVPSSVLAESKSRSLASTSPYPDPLHIFQATVALSPFEVKNPTVLRVSAKLNTELVLGPRLQILLADQGQFQESQPS